MILFNVLIIQDGLDFNHCVSSLTSLARFHAISYCYRKEKDIEMLGIARKFKCTDSTSNISVFSGFVEPLKIAMDPHFRIPHFINQNVELLSLP